MNKSKFKYVHFKPLDIALHFLERPDGTTCWTNNAAFGNNLVNDVYFSDSLIEQYPELFEVEKAERVFEEGAYYKAMFASHSVPEIIQRFRGNFQRMGLNLVYIETDFHEIGEKIKL